MLKLFLCLSSLIHCFIIGNLAYADVYPDTINQRLELSAEDKQHLLHLGELGKGGCSASALTPDTLITAEHCLELQADGKFDLTLAKGYFELDPTQTFQMVTQVSKNSKTKLIKPLDVSSHYANDVMIVKIKWTSGSAPSMLRYPHAMANTESQLKIGTTDSEATKLFALGYPHDLDRRATHSWGYLRGTQLWPRTGAAVDPYTHDRTLESLYLKINVPLIGGNSGGPIYTDDYKLVGIVHGGSLTNDTEKLSADFNSQTPKFWNEVGALYFLYPQMKTLQTLFPDGVNPNVNEAGEWIGVTK